MGSATKHRQQFLAKHPLCIFCGGNRQAVSIEHCPPRAMFQNRQWPEGFEFPACLACNEGSSDHDLIVAMMARMDPFEDRGNLDGRHIGLMTMVNRQYPGLFERMLFSANEARKHNRELGIQPRPGLTQQQAGAVRITEEFHEAVKIFAAKLTKGIYYNATNSIFPNDGCLLLNWFSNADLIRDGRYTIFDLFGNIGGEAPRLMRTGVFLNDQFEYKLSLSPVQDVLIIQARFGASFGFVVFGSLIPGHLEEIVTRLRQQADREGPFAVLQSSVLNFT